MDVRTESIITEAISRTKLSHNPWIGEEISEYRDSHCPASLDELLSGLLSYELPPGVLPLATNRFPFADIPAAIIEAGATAALTMPYLKGRLTDSIRRLAGFERKRPSNYVILESHIDLTESNSDLTNALLVLGFEPDNFAKIQPPQYRRHFTLQYVCRQGLAKKKLYERVRRAANKASELIDSDPTVVGYVETELYTHRYAVEFPFTPRSSNEAQAPFLDDYFKVLPVFTSETEFASPDFDSQEKRAADIHVKVGPQLRRLADLNDALDSPIGDLLKSVGFYEILSEGGNYMYSAHFAELAEANGAYRRLVDFARASGGIRGIVREVCTEFWRKEYIDPGGGTRLAEVPPHLRLATYPLRVRITASEYRSQTTAP